MGFLKVICIKCPSPSCTVIMHFNMKKETRPFLETQFSIWYIRPVFPKFGSAEP